MEDNWRNGRQTLTRIECHSENSKGVYCLQYDEKHIVSGLRDNTIKVHCRLDVIDVTQSFLFSPSLAPPIYYRYGDETQWSVLKC